MPESRDTGPLEPGKTDSGTPAYWLAVHVALWGARLLIHPGGKP